MVKMNGPKEFTLLTVDIAEAKVQTAGDAVARVQRRITQDLRKKTECTLIAKVAIVFFFEK